MSDARMKKKSFADTGGRSMWSPPFGDRGPDEVHAASISSCDTLTSGKMRGDSVEVRAVPVVFIVECIREEATVQ